MLRVMGYAMIGEIFFALWFFLPAASANMAPIIASKTPVIKEWDAPLDGRRLWRGKPLLGKNKTWRGLVAGIVASTVTFWVQQLLVKYTPWAGQGAEIGYATLPLFVLGPLFAIGTLGGDACKSFFKRQYNAEPGRPWPFFDQVGEIVGAIIVMLPFVSFGFGVYLGVIVCWVVIDFGVSFLSYLAGWKERPL